MDFVEFAIDKLVSVKKETAEELPTAKEVTKKTVKSAKNIK